MPRHEEMPRLARECSGYGGGACETGCVLQREDGHCSDQTRASDHPPNDSAARRGQAIRCDTTRDLPGRRGRTACTRRQAGASTKAARGDRGGRGQARHQHEVPTRPSPGSSAIRGTSQKRHHARRLAAAPRKTNPLRNVFVRARRAEDDGRDVRNRAAGAVR